MALRPVTVSQLNEYISRVLTTDPLLGNISVKGEISNLKYHSSGHVYFSMVDEGGKVNCFFPSTYVKELNYQLGDGLEVTINGYVNVYKKGGTYTLFVRSIQVSGEGNLAMAFELLKEKLEKEGLFDQKHKKPLPEFPRKVGIVTSQTGAAVRDILKIITQRTKMVDVTIFPVLVQGPDAAFDIAQTLDLINRRFSDIDILIVGRGGGSTEDLWPFNEEVLARAVFASDIPVISAVGHETDFTICDFVADLRAETPTAAAEKAVPQDNLLLDTIESYRRDLTENLTNRMAYSQLKAQNGISEIKNLLLRRIDGLKHSAERYFLTLEENNPLNILSKGYAILEDENRNVVTSVENIKENSRYSLHLKDGTVEITLSHVKKAGEQR